MSASEVPQMRGQGVGGREGVMLTTERPKKRKATLTSVLLPFELDLATGIAFGALSSHDTENAEETEDTEDDDEADPDRLPEQPLSYRHVRHVVL